MKTLFGRAVGSAAVADPEPVEDEALDTGGYLDDEEAETDDEEVDDLADFDDDARTTVESLIEKRVAAATRAQNEALRAQAQAGGFDFTQDGRLVVGDMNRAQEYVGAPHRRDSQLQVTPQAIAAPEVDLTQIPDPTLYPQEHQRWLDAYVQSKVASVQSDNVSTRNMVAQLMANEATGRAIAEMERLNYGEFTKHPQFQTKFREYLLQLPAEQWVDPTNLARVGFLIMPELLAGAPLPAAAPSRKQPPAETVANNYASRAGAPSFMPSREAGRAPRPEAASEEDQIMARALGVSIAEVRALRSPDGQVYSDYKQSQKKEKARR